MIRACAIAALLSLAPAAAGAQEPELAAGERRPVPDLDGRPEVRDDVADALLWVPRIAFAPLYMLVEYVLRGPIGWFLTTAERDQWGLFSVSGPAPGTFVWGIIPTIFIDFGFRSAGGVYLWFDNLGFTGHSVRVRAGFGGVDWMRFAITDRIAFDERSSLSATVLGNMRPDYTFVGLGPDEASAERVARYGRRRIDATLAFTHRPFRSSHVRASFGVSANELYDTAYYAPPEQTMTRAARQGWFPSLGTEPPPGFDGYTVAWGRVEGSVDTRQRGLGIDRGGVRAEAFVEVDGDVYDTDCRWVEYGGGAGGFWDVDSGRTVGLWVSTSFVTPFGTEPVPFTELPDFGARGRLTGFRRGWIVGPSAISATLEYRYPIWAALDGFVSTGIGNAFGPELRDFALEDLRMSFMVGLRTIGDPDHAITVQMGFGTRTFAQGLDPAVFRLTVGTQEGF